MTRIFRSPPVVALTSGVLLIVFLVACNSVRDTGRRQVNLLSPGKEAALGFSEFEKIKKNRTISNEPNHNAQVRRVGARLAEVMPVEGAKWEFVVFEDDTPNAFALPGGKVGVHTGLFQVTQSDEGLAAVIGHEVAHVVARHSGERMSHGIISAVAVAGASKMMEKKTDSRAGQIATGAVLGGGALLHNRSFSRKQELEADQLGALYMARAGYDPHESVSLWERFAAFKEANGQAPKASLLSTHPVDSVRIAELKAFMPRAMAEYRG